eukprot:m.1269578 g.1269578  ORF g.1269578 m.1269578 type:complete len:753 (+) comp24747_c0_seq6:262-2520(+)
MMPQITAALAHFCEKHGPRVVLRTQFISSQGEPLGVNQSRNPQTNHVQSDDSDVSEKKGALQGHALFENCPACGWTASAPGYLTQNASIYGEAYFVTAPPSCKNGDVSSSVPSDESVDDILQRSCIRAMTCEVCAGDQGPLLFGDATSGYTYAYAFEVADIEARGGTRRYTALLFSFSRGPLITIWDHATSILCGMINDLRQAVNATAVSKEGVLSVGPGSEDPTDSTGCAVDCAATTSQQSTSAAHVPIGRLPHSPSKEPRTIEELSGQCDFASRMHSIFVDILQGALAPICSGPAPPVALPVDPSDIRTSVHFQSRSLTKRAQSPTPGSPCSSASCSSRTETDVTAQHVELISTPSMDVGGQTVRQEIDESPPGCSTADTDVACNSNLPKDASVVMGTASSGGSETAIGVPVVSTAAGDGRRDWSRVSSANSLWSMSSGDSGNSTARRGASGLVSIGSSIGSLSPRSPVPVPGIVDCFFDLVALSPAKPTSYSHVAREVIREARELLEAGTITQREFEHILNVQDKLETEISVPRLTLRDIANFVGRHHFAAIISNIVVGNQCIVHAAREEWRRVVLDALKNVLPSTTSSVVYSSPRYLHVYEAQFLGLEPGVSVPSAACVQLSVAAETCPRTYEVLCWDIKLHPNRNQASNPPVNTYTSDLCDYLDDESRPIACDIAWLEVHKDRWVHFASAFFTLCNVDPVVSDERVTALITILGLVNTDVRVLRFLTSALPPATRQRILLLCKQSCS